jgi:hypothetical protein
MDRVLRRGLRGRAASCCATRSNSSELISVQALGPPFGGNSRWASCSRSKGGGFLRANDALFRCKPSDLDAFATEEASDRELLAMFWH